MCEFFIKKKLIDEDLIKNNLTFTKEDKDFKSNDSSSEVKANFMDEVALQNKITETHTPQDAKEIKEELKVKFGDIKTTNEELSPRRIWGKLVVRLKEKGLMTLHSACGEQRDVKLVNGKLIVNIRDEFTYNLIKKPENFQKIDLELKQINDKINVEFNLEKRSRSRLERNLLTLKELFGDEIDIK